METCVFDISIKDLQPGILFIGHSINVTMKFNQFTYTKIRPNAGIIFPKNPPVACFTDCL